MSYSVALSQDLTERSLIESILSSFYIVDYGFIKKVNGDKTVNVIHAKRLKTISGENLAQVETKNIEVLTLSTAGISFNLEYKSGDKVLLLGLKNLVEKVEDTKLATESKIYTHYSRSTLKAIPLCVFNADSLIKIEAAKGSLKINTNKNVELNGNTKSFVTWDELNTALQNVITLLKSHTHPVPNGTSSTSLELATMALDITSAKTTTIKTGG